MKKPVLYVARGMSSAQKRAKRRAFPSIESETKIKTESVILTIRQMYGGKFHHWTFCDDKTKCSALWYLQSAIN